MASPVEFEGVNTALTAPPGQEETVQTLYCFRNGRDIVSAWKLTPAELEEVNRTGLVWLNVLSGMTLFPVYVGGSAEEVRALCADAGATFPKQP